MTPIHYTYNIGCIAEEAEFESSALGARKESEQHQPSEALTVNDAIDPVLEAANINSHAKERIIVEEHEVYHKSSVDIGDSK
ncbi:hypothetical protein RRF57_006639 [Xylaria bambusicola]|uniref:Uncharacterized protein n=1 Tax=Xylaria bambusicola TaxID=326684 RepID=A0AAN7UP68_9PEZI